MQRVVETVEPAITPVAINHINFNQSIVAYEAGASGPAVLTRVEDHTGKSVYGFSYHIQGCYNPPYTRDTLKFVGNHPQTSIERALKNNREVFAFKDRREFYKWAATCG